MNTTQRAMLTRKRRSGNAQRARVPGLPSGAFIGRVRADVRHMYLLVSAEVGDGARVDRYRTGSTSSSTRCSARGFRPGSSRGPPSRRPIRSSISSTAGWHVRSRGGCPSRPLPEERGALLETLTTNWRSQASRGPARLAAGLGPREVRCFGIYLGARQATYEPCRVLPLAEFLRLLWAGEILG